MKDREFSRLAQLIVERHFPDDLDDFREKAAARGWSHLLARAEDAKPTLGKTESGMSAAILAAAWLVTLSELYTWLKHNGRPDGDAEKKDLESRISKAIARSADAPADAVRLAATIMITVLETIQHIQ